MDNVKEKRIIAFSKNVSWILLTIYFVFDSVVSYWAVTGMGGRELNLVIAPFVGKNPLLYFFAIPAELIGAYFIVWLLKKWIVERVVLTAAAIYWPIANSSMNLLFLLGFRNYGYLWGPLTIIGFVITLLYGVVTLLRRR